MKGYTPWPEVSSERMRAGNYMEHGVHAWCEGEYGWELINGPPEGKFHPEHEMLYGLVDRLKVEHKEPVSIVEFKNVDGFMEKHWKEGPPEKYKAQVHFYSMLYELPAIIVACFGGNHFERYEVPRNPLVEKFILGECLKFWNDLQEDRWPEPDGSDDCAKTLSALYASQGEKMLVGSPEALCIAREYRFLSAQIKELEAQKNLLANQLRQKIGDNQGIIFADGSKVTWKMTVPKTPEFDEDRFALENPEIHAEYQTLSAGYRRLNVSIKE
jgi:hypothetical protein